VAYQCYVALLLEVSVVSNQIKRDAKRIIHEHHYMMPAVPREALPYVARGLAKAFNLPEKTMLKAMARYKRLHLSRGA
jgi:hypothetical protein